MGKRAARLERLERELDARRPALPFLYLSYGLDADGLYHGKERAYTRDEVAELEKTHQLIVLCYGDDPRNDPASVIQMTWGDEGEKPARDVAPGRA